MPFNRELGFGLKINWDWGPPPNKNPLKLSPLFTLFNVYYSRGMVLSFLFEGTFVLNQRN